MIEIKRVDWHPEAAIAAVDQAAQRAEGAAAESLLNRARERAPYRTGALAASGSIGEGEDGTLVGFSARHALPVHAHPEWHYAAGRSAHWLEEALEQEASEYEATVAGELERGWP